MHQDPTQPSSWITVFHRPRYRSTKYAFDVPRLAKIAWRTADIVISPWKIWKHGRWPRLPVPESVLSVLGVLTDSYDWPGQECWYPCRYEVMPWPLLQTKDKDQLLGIIIPYLTTSMSYVIMQGDTACSFSINTLHRLSLAKLVCKASWKLAIWSWSAFLKPTPTRPGWGAFCFHDRPESWHLSVSRVLSSCQPFLC